MDTGQTKLRAVSPFTARLALLSPNPLRFCGCRSHHRGRAGQRSRHFHPPRTLDSKPGGEQGGGKTPTSGLSPLHRASKTLQSTGWYGLCPPCLAQQGLPLPPAAARSTPAPRVLSPDRPTAQPRPHRVSGASQGTGLWFPAQPLQKKIRAPWEKLDPPTHRKSRWRWRRDWLL